MSTPERTSNDRAPAAEAPRIDPDGFVANPKITGRLTQELGVRAVPVASCAMVLAVVRDLPGLDRSDWRTSHVLLTGKGGAARTLAPPIGARALRALAQPTHTGR